MEDKILWDVNKKGQYTVKANYMHMETERIDNYLVGLIWNNRVPPKASVFTWEVWWGKVLTGGPIKEKGFSACKQMPDVQRGGGKFKSLIFALPHNLEILGPPHCFVRNGMGLPITD